jgi:predicted anti-sigma-YlaC factor YlaD
MPPARPAAQGDLDPCPGLADVASDYLEGDLDEDSARAVAAHLQHCSDCLRFYAELALTILAMRRLAPRMGLTPGRLEGAKG